MTLGNPEALVKQWIRLVTWTAKKIIGRVLTLNKAEVKTKLLDTVKARKLTYYDHTIRKQDCCLKKEIKQGTMPGARRRGRPRTAWMDNINMWKSQSEWPINGESTSMVWPTLGSRTAKEQNNSRCTHCCLLLLLRANADTQWDTRMLVQCSSSKVNSMQGKSQCNWWGSVRTPQLLNLRATHTVDAWDNTCNMSWM